MISTTCQLNHADMPRLAQGEIAIAPHENIRCNALPLLAPYITP